MEDQRNITVQIPVVNKRSVLPFLFGASILFFFFTFCEISCGNQRLAAITGIEMITGTEIKGGDMFGKEFESMLKQKAKSLGADDEEMDAESDESPTEDGPGNKSIPPNIWGILALLGAITGLVVFLIRIPQDGLIGGIAGIVAALSLLIMQLTMTSAVKEQGGGFAMIEITFTLAYWGALLFLFTGGVLGLMSMRPKTEEPAPPPIAFAEPDRDDKPQDEQF